MCKSVRDCLVTGYEPLIDSLDLPDPGDRHVLAAAIKAHAGAIITFNGKHFPAANLGSWSIEAKDPDEFLLDQFHLDAITVHKAVQSIADTCRNPPLTANDVLDRLEAQGAVQVAALLRR